MTDEPYINTKDKQKVAHVAILITNTYEGDKELKECFNCRTRMLEFLKDGTFDNGTIKKRLELIKEIQNLRDDKEGNKDEINEYEDEMETLNTEKDKEEKQCFYSLHNAGKEKIDEAL